MSPIINIKAFTGTNPIGMLASLGAFRIAAMTDPHATLHWSIEGGCTPVITTTMNQEEFITASIRELYRLAGPKARSTRKLQLDGEKAKMNARLNVRGRNAPGPEERETLQGQIEAIDAILGGLQGHHPDGVPVINENELVTIPRDKFRTPALELTRRSQTPHTPQDSDYYASLGCDGILKEKKGQLLVEPTPFSFSNGGSGKCLLKDFKNCAAHSSLHTLHDLIDGHFKREDEVTSLLWDPADQQSYAHRWSDPGNRTVSPPRANATINALAFVGLTFLPVVPTGNRIIAVGMDKRLRKWTWPLWTLPATSPIVSSLLATQGLDDPTPSHRHSLRQRGIEAIYSSRRFFLNKRPFFSPSRAI